MKGIVKQMEDEEYHMLLKGQSMYCLTRYTEIISIKFKELFPTVITASIICMEDAPESVQLICCRAIATFFRKFDKHGL